MCLCLFRFTMRFVLGLSLISVASAFFMAPAPVAPRGRALQMVKVRLIGSVLLRSRSGAGDEDSN